MIDKENMLGILEDYPNQIIKGYGELGESVKVDCESKEIRQIVFAGMGGSAIPGDIMQAYLRDQIDIPVLVHKSYDLPHYVNKHTLLFIVSYSGNTEETLSSYRQAKVRGCTTVCIASGGKLKEAAIQDKRPLITIPAGIQPRLSTGYIFFSVLRVLVEIGIIKDCGEQVKQLADKLHNPEFKMKGEELSATIGDKMPVIYATDTLMPVSYLWKIAFNENCKIPAISNYLPELNHNEMLAYTSPKVKFHVIFIKEEGCHPRVDRRFKLTRDIVAKTATTTEMLVKGTSQLTKLFTAIYIGYWTAYFLALRYQVDPTSVELIEKLKKQL